MAHLRYLRNQVFNVLRILFQQVVQWVDEGSAGAEHNEGDEVKVTFLVSLSNVKFYLQGGWQCEDSGRKEACDGFQDKCSFLQG